MSAAAILGILATSGGVILALAPVAQMRLVVARRSSEGISVGYWVVLIVAMSLWLAYGVVTRNPAIIVANVVSVATATAMVVVLLRYRTGTRNAQVPEVASGGRDAVLAGRTTPHQSDHGGWVDDTSGVGW